MAISSAVKTATGIAHWRPERCVAQVMLPGCSADLGLPTLSPAAAAAAGARVLIVGAAEFGGRISPSLGADAAGGAGGGPGSRGRTARTTGRRARHPPRRPRRLRAHACTTCASRRAGSWRSRPAPSVPACRLLTVGTDCAVGKMFTSLSIEAELQPARCAGDAFAPRGQTGILISGSGVSVDAIVSDFISGAAELLSPANRPEHWDVIEGQGSLHHPAYAGVTLGLIHGSQPDALVLCHRIDLEHIDGYPRLPDAQLRRRPSPPTRAPRA